MPPPEKDSNKNKYPQKRTQRAANHNNLRLFFIYSVTKADSLNILCKKKGTELDKIPFF